MRNIKMVLLLWLLYVMSCGCSASLALSGTENQTFDYKRMGFKDKCLQHNKNRAIRTASKKADTLYIYNVAFTDWKMLWFHSNKYIYSCIIYPTKIQWGKPLEAENFSVDQESIRACFELTFHRDIQCFEDALDGESIDIIINGDRRSCCINTECLLKQEFKVGSFPYKLQYDLSKIFQKDTTQSGSKQPYF